MNELLFDCHVHLGPSDSGELYYGHLRGEEYLDLMNAAGVGRAIAFAPLRLEGYGPANRALADWCDGAGAGRVRPLARVGGRRIGLTEPRLWLLRRKLRRLIGSRSADVNLDELHRYAGVKLLPHLDGLPGSEVFDRAAELNLPVLTHAGRFVPASWLARAVLPNIRTKLVLAHLGAFPAQRRELEQAVELAAREPRVYLDTSGIWIAEFLRYAVQRVPRKLLFGSDCPLTHPAAAWAMVESVVGEAALRRRIGRDASEEIFPWP